MMTAGLKQEVIDVGTCGGTVESWLSNKDELEILWKELLTIANKESFSKAVNLEAVAEMKLDLM